MFAKDIQCMWIYKYECVCVGVTENVFDFASSVTILFIFTERKMTWKKKQHPLEKKSVCLYSQLPFLFISDMFVYLYIYNICVQIEMFAIATQNEVYEWKFVIKWECKHWQKHSVKFINLYPLIFMFTYFHIHFVLRIAGAMYVHCEYIPDDL